jgi:hypothetical protein
MVILYKKYIVSSERVTVTNPKMAVWVQNVTISCWNSPLCIYIRCGSNSVNTAEERSQRGFRKCPYKLRRAIMSVLRT